MVLLPEMEGLSLEDDREEASTGMRGPGGSGGSGRPKLPRKTPYLDYGERNTFYELLEKRSTVGANWRTTSTFKAFDTVLAGWWGCYELKPPAQIFLAVEQFFQEFVAPAGVTAPVPDMGTMSPHDVVHYYVGGWQAVLLRMAEEEKGPNTEFYAQREREAEHLFEMIELLWRKRPPTADAALPRDWVMVKISISHLYVGRGDNRPGRFNAGTTYYEQSKEFQARYLAPFGIDGEALKYYNQGFGPEEMIVLFQEWIVQLERYIFVAGLRDEAPCGAAAAAAMGTGAEMTFGAPVMLPLSAYDENPKTKRMQQQQAAIGNPSPENVIDVFVRSFKFAYPMIKGVLDQTEQHRLVKIAAAGVPGAPVRSDLDFWKGIMTGFYGVDYGKSIEVIKKRIKEKEEALADAATATIKDVTTGREFKANALAADIRAFRAVVEEGGTFNADQNGEGGYRSNASWWPTPTSGGAGAVELKLNKSLAFFESTLQQATGWRKAIADLTRKLAPGAALLTLQDRGQKENELKAYRANVAVLRKRLGAGIATHAQRLRSGEAIRGILAPGAESGWVNPDTLTLENMIAFLTWRVDTRKAMLADLDTMNELLRSNKFEQNRIKGRLESLRTLMGKTKEDFTRMAEILNPHVDLNDPSAQGAMQLKMDDFQFLASMFHVFPRAVADEGKPDKSIARPRDTSGALGDVTTPLQMYQKYRGEFLDLKVLAGGDKGASGDEARAMYRILGPRWTRDLRFQRYLVHLAVDVAGLPPKSIKFPKTQTSNPEGSGHVRISAGYAQRIRGRGGGEAMEVDGENEDEDEDGGEVPEIAEPSAIQAGRAFALAVEVAARKTRADLGRLTKLTELPGDTVEELPPIGTLVDWDVKVLGGQLHGGGANTWLTHPVAGYAVDCASNRIVSIFRGLAGLWPDHYNQPGMLSAIGRFSEDQPNGWARRAAQTIAKGKRPCRTLAIVLAPGERGIKGTRAEHEVVEFSRTKDNGLPVWHTTISAGMRYLFPTFIDPASGSVPLPGADAFDSPRRLFAERGAHLFDKLYPAVIDLRFNSKKDDDLVTEEELFSEHVISDDREPAWPPQSTAEERARRWQQVAVLTSVAATKKYANPKVAEHLIAFRDSPTHMIAIGATRSHSFLMIKDPDMHAAAEDTWRRERRLRTRRIYFVHPYKEKMQITYIVRRAFTQDQSPTKWEPINTLKADKVDPNGQAMPFHLLRRNPEQAEGGEDAHLQVSLARGLLACIALEARARSPPSIPPYPWRGTVEHESMPEMKAEMRAYGATASADVASLTSSFAVGYGPACAALSSICVHAGASEHHYQDFEEWDPVEKRFGRVITGEKKARAWDDVLYEVTDIRVGQTGEAGPSGA